MARNWVTISLIGLAVLLDLLVAISLPFFPSLDLFIVGVNFSNGTTTTNTVISSDTGDTTVFNGQVNSVSVQGVTDIQLGLWASCFIQDQSGVSNTTCFTPSFGYKVIVQAASSSFAVNLVQSSWTGALFFQPLAGGLTLISLFTGAHAKHYLVMAAAIALTGIASIVEFALFTSVSKITPLLGSQVKAALGPGFFLGIVSFLVLLVSVLTTYIQT